MEGKSVLVLGTGNEGRHSVWASLREYRLRVILVDKNENNHGVDQVDKFYHYDFSDHLKDTIHKEKILNLLKLERIDGCLTFSESCIPLTAMICDELTLPGGNVKAAQIIKNKYSVLEQLASSPATKPYSTAVVNVTNVGDLEKVSENFPFPAVLKPVYGSGSACIKKVESKEEAIYQYVRMQEKYYKTRVFGREANGFSNDMILMEFLEGSKQEVDVVVSKGVQILCIISDYAPSITENFFYTCYQLPSRLPSHQQNAMITATDLMSKAIGIEDGGLCYEFRYTKAGPKLVEVNGRLGMVHRQENIKKCFDVDILKYTVQTLLGISTPSLLIAPKTNLAAVVCYESLHGKQLKDKDVKKYVRNQEMRGDFRLIPYSRDTHLIEEFEQPLCCITFYDNNIDNAKSRMVDMFETCKLDSPCYNIRGLLKTLI